MHNVVHVRRLLTRQLQADAAQHICLEEHDVAYIIAEPRMARMDRRQSSSHLAVSSKIAIPW